MRKRAMIAGAALAMVLAFDGSAAAQGLMVAGRFGTLGLGVDASVAVGSRLALRAGAGFQPWEPSHVIDEIDFELELRSPAWLVAADLYVAGPLRLSGGLAAFGSDISVRARLTEDVEIGNGTYSPSEIGTLTGDFDTNDVAPWVAIGFGRATGRGVGLTFDLGVAFQGEPVVSLASDGPLADTPEFQANLAREEQNIQDDAKLVKLYPVVSLGITIGF